MSIKELIVAEIITPLKISEGVVIRGVCQLEELGVILRNFENRRSSQREIARIECKLPVADFLPKQPTRAFATSTSRLQQVARVLPKPPTGRPRPRLTKVAKWQKRDHALLSLG